MFYLRCYEQSKHVDVHCSHDGSDLLQHSKLDDRIISLWVGGAFPLHHQVEKHLHQCNIDENQPQLVQIQGATEFNAV